MKWLFVTSSFPWPIIHGRWLRVYHLARMLREQGDDVSILSFQADGKGVEAYGEIGVSVVDGPSGSHISQGPARCPIGPYAFDASMAEAIAGCAEQFDAVVLSGSRLLQYAKEASAAGKVVAEFVDDPVLELRRKLWRTVSPMRWARRLKFLIGQPRYEKTFLDPVDVSIFVSEQDCESFSRRQPGRRVEFVPNGVDVEYFRRPDDHADQNGSPDTVTFTGHMSNLNNERAGRFLVDKIAPIIHRTHPDVRIQIVGADPTEAVLSMAGPAVEVTGRVDDIRPYLWNASVVILPMQSGTGIKNKLLEAWAAGASVVATPLACQGVRAEHGKNIMLGKTADELARHTISLLADRQVRKELSSAGQQVVQDDLTWSAVSRRFRQVVLDNDKF